MGKSTIQINLDEETCEKIELAAKKIKCTQHGLIKKAVFYYLEKLEEEKNLLEIPANSSNSIEEKNEVTNSIKEKHQPFLKFTEQILPQSTIRSKITSAYLSAETDIIPEILNQARLSKDISENIQKLAYQISTKLRNQHQKNNISRSKIAQELLQEFSLSSQEGLALMCLSEALLRIPDKPTQDALIRDKITQGNWKSHLGKSSSLFVNAATWGLFFTERLISHHSETNLSRALHRILRKSGEPIIRKGMDVAMRLMGEQFVAGQNIEEALSNAQKFEEKGFRYSYDMLGEAALTDSDAQGYIAAYQKAIHAIGKISNYKGIYEGPGISIKLSALHPRYCRSQYSRVIKELYPRLKSMVVLARQYDIGINIDAEEAERLEISLDLLEKLCFEPELTGWNGIGFVIQSYQKRCLFVIDYLIDLAMRSKHRLMIRLVKGAYWDSEIKHSQIEGLEGYPVYTRKAYTDISYLACAKKLLKVPHLIYPQFATHNAHTLSTIYYLAGINYYPGQYEFQCLYGMGEPIYKQIIGKIIDGKLNRPCRIYAPVGNHKTLLAYLVRRLLENGANTSFINRINDTSFSLEKLVEDPVVSVEKLIAQSEGKIGLPHPKIPLPRNLYNGERINSLGLDLTNEHHLSSISYALLNDIPKAWKAKPVLKQPVEDGDMKPIINPADSKDVVGYVREANEKEIAIAIENSVNYAPIWYSISPCERASILDRTAFLLEDNIRKMIGILIREAGKTFRNAISEIREAVDFLRYYAALVRSNFDNKTHYPLGPIVCISPWNFPAAIFTGQIAAALAAGNSVIAKPAEQTPLIAAQIISFFLQAGVPKGVIQFLPGRGRIVGMKLISDDRIRGVIFTGSTEIASLVQKTIATRLDQKGNPIPIIAETGGINSMIIDSSALTEQVVTDVISSSFDSAGQRCSALRILFLQEEIADHTIKMLRGALAEYRMGNPTRLSTDIGPVINAEAKFSIEQHIQLMRVQGKKIFQAILDSEENTEEWKNGNFVIPTLIEISSFKELKKEIFGPVLHIVRYKRNQLDHIIDQINSSGYGLTMGVHSRIDETISKISNKAKVGNIYINRNMIGAVVGVQPFGGEGLSGTGPKAGGPLYLYRLLSNRPNDAISNMIAHYKKNCFVDKKIKITPTPLITELTQWTKDYPLIKDLYKKYKELSQIGIQLILSGPTGERNIWMIQPRTRVLCIADNEQDSLIQLSAMIAIGCNILWEEDDLHCSLSKKLPKSIRDLICFAKKEYLMSEFFDAVIYHGSSNGLREICKIISERKEKQAIIPVQGFLCGESNILIERFYLERSISENTAAVGGNASLITIE